MTILKLILSFDNLKSLHHNCGAVEGVNTVNAAAAVGAVEEAVIALLAPAWAPGVLDEPVGKLLVEQRVVVLPVAHDQHAVVHAARVAHELEGVAAAAAVELHRVGVEARADGAILQQPLPHLGLVLSDHHAATCDLLNLHALSSP